jgi:hypothetical protein
MSRADRWTKVTVPVLVIAGGASAAWMHNGADALSSVLPSATRQTLEGQTHLFAPEVLAPVLVEVFKS